MANKLWWYHILEYPFTNCEDIEGNVLHKLSLKTYQKMELEKQHKV